jgi:adenylate kinase
MAIIVTGSVGTGKTSFAKKLAKKLNYKYVDVNKLISEKNLDEGYDEERECKIIDTKKLNKTLIKLIKKDNKLVIDSHMSHYLPKKYVEKCYVTKCNLKELEKRLKKRNYPKEKIRENLDTEIFDICLEEAKEAEHNIEIIDTSVKNK